VTRALVLALACALVATACALVATACAHTRRLDGAARSELVARGAAARFVALPLGTMHVRIEGPGDGPVVVLVHGGVVGGYAFERWRAPLVAAGFRVIVPDLLGYGYSDRPDRTYTRQFYVAQLAQLLDALEVAPPVALVGASLGGAIATAFTAAYPERVRALALIAPAGGGGSPPIRGALIWPVIGDIAFHFFGASSMTSQMATAYAGSPYRAGMVQWMQAQTAFRGFSSGILNTLRHFNASWQPDTYQALGRSGTPVLAVWGTADTINPFAQARTLAGWVPQLQLVALAGKGHAITFGETETVLAEVIPFLRAH
jgi:pimeloyl-ACP methyl ester carboxylesterase